MARSDLPPGYIPTGQGRGAVLNPATGRPFPARGAYNPATGHYIGRRQLESPRIRQELGLPPTAGVYEAKARARAMQLYKLPARHKIHYTKVDSHGTRQRVVWEGRAGYHFRSFNELLRAVRSLPRGTRVYIKVLGRHRFPDPRNSPTFYGARSRKGRLLRADRLRWVSPQKGQFLSEYVDREVPHMLHVLEDMYDIRRFDLIVLG